MQLYGEQLECLPGLFRVELYARLVKLNSPDMCRANTLP